MSRESTRVDFDQLRLKKTFIIKNQKDIVLTISFFLKKKQSMGFLLSQVGSIPVLFFKTQIGLGPRMAH
jgi:hypothetical protein